MATAELADALIVGWDGEPSEWDEAINHLEIKSTGLVRSHLERVGRSDVAEALVVPKFVREKTKPWV